MAVRTRLRATRAVAHHQSQRNRWFVRQPFDLSRKLRQHQQRSGWNLAAAVGVHAVVRRTHEQIEGKRNLAKSRACALQTATWRLAVDVVCPGNAVCGQERRETCSAEQQLAGRPSSENGNTSNGGSSAHRGSSMSRSQGRHSTLMSTRTLRC